MKECNKCHITKSRNEFGIDNTINDGLRRCCKCCKRKSDVAYKRTLNGFIRATLAKQKYSSKKRGHNAPEYTFEELEKYLLTDSNFTNLFKCWELSSYRKELTPSLDRINPYLPYTLNNIQVMTWRENDAKGILERGIRHLNQTRYL